MKHLKRSLIPHQYRPGCRIFFTALIILLTFSPGLISGQTLDDFKKSSTYSFGIELIPYKDTRVEANHIAQEVDRYKAEAMASKKYSLFESEKNNLLKEIQKIQADIDEENKIAKKAGVAPDPRQMKKLEEAMTKVNTKVTSLNRNMEPVAESFRRFYNARAALREKFNDVLEKELPQSKSHPEKHLGKSPSAAQIKELNEYIEIIETRIHAQEKTHRDQEVGAKGTYESFVELLARTRPA